MFHIIIEYLSQKYNVEAHLNFCIEIYLFVM